MLLLFIFSSIQLEMTNLYYSFKMSEQYEPFINRTSSKFLLQLSLASILAPDIVTDLSNIANFSTAVLLLCD